MLIFPQVDRTLVDLLILDQITTFRELLGDRNSHHNSYIICDHHTRMCVELSVLLLCVQCN